MSEAQTGRTISAEHRQKISESKSGENNPHYDKTHSKETRRKISEALTGRVTPKETRRKISESLTGNTLSKETRRKISETEKGRTTPEETRRKISEAHMGKTRSEETCRKMSEAMTGRTISEETRRKMSEAHMGRSLSAEHRRKISEGLTGKTFSETRIKNILEGIGGEFCNIPTRHTVRNGWERKIDLMLHDAGFNFEYESKAFHIGDGRKYTPDFKIGDTIIEVKGHDWGNAVERAERFMDHHPQYRYVVIGNGDIPCDVHFSWGSRENVLDILQ